MKSTEKSIIKNIILIIVLIIAIFSYVYTSTPLFFDESSLGAIHIYYSTSQGNVVDLSIKVGEGPEQPTIGSKQKFLINFVKFSINEPFKGSMGEYTIQFIDFEEEIDFYEESDNGIYLFNHTKMREYEIKNIPDYLIKGGFIKEGFVPVWSQIWHSGPSMSVYTEPFLKQTSYGVWEGEYFFDTTFSGTHPNDETYLTAEVNKIIFEIKIPEKYEVQNKNNFKISKTSDGILLTKELHSGETFHLILIDSQKDMSKKIISVISLVIFGIILGIYIQQWYQRRNK